MTNRFYPKQPVMPRPENVLIDAFFLTNAFFSILPAAFIIVKGKYFKEVLNLLMSLCLLNFIENILLVIIPHSQATDQTTIQNIFSVVELMLVIQMFSSALHGKSKDILSIFSIIFLTSIVTFYLSKGAGEKRMSIEIIFQIIIILTVGSIFFYFIEQHGLLILNYPLFWIAVGTLFYYLIALLVNIIDSGSAAGNDRIIMLNIASVVRYIFYVLAVLFQKDNGKPGNSSSIL